MLIFADIDCGNLENPGNGTVQLKATIFNSLVKYRCNEGFKLVGASERRCSKFGSWSPDAPLCYGHCYFSVRIQGAIIKDCFPNNFTVFENHQQCATVFVFVGL